MAISDASHTITDIESPGRRHGRAAPSARAAGLVVGLMVVVIVALLSLRFGSLTISTADAWNGLFHYEPDNYAQTIVRKLRLPRTIIAISVGGALGVAGAIMQGVTRNPLADPSILGVSQGASLGVAIAVTYLGIHSPAGFVWFGFAGALAAALLVFAVGSAGRGGGGPLNLALAGVVIAALLSAWTSTLLLIREETMDALRFWLAGSIAGRGLDLFWTVSPLLIGGVIASFLLGHQLNVLSMGDDNARALGMRTTRMRLLASGIVVLITGAAVAVAGPIGFVGLATPHIARSLVGADFRWILPYSFLLGAIVLTVADIAGRLVARPAELQVGIVTALVGAPFLIWLARSARLGA